MSTNKQNYPTIKNAALALAVALAVSGAPAQDASARSITTEQHAINKATLTHTQRPRIQMAILLDTSSSMDGLIDQARNQLWNVVNEFSTAKRGGQTPTLEVALFEYGNSALSQQSGYIRKLSHFTGELDLISEGLFSLKTGGGDEYCGMAVKTAVNSLQWSQSNNDIKVIFIAGNEPFTQGPVDHTEAVALAKQRGISVNTIFAGDHKSGVSGGWQLGAQLAGGNYMSIDANRTIVHVAAPQDQEIAKLNSQLNQTYVPYGALGKDSADRQLEQDQKSGSISGALLAKRAKSKSSSYYSNSRWDLVDAIKEGKMQDEDLAELEEEQLPEVMKGMNTEERKNHVAEQAKKRDELKSEISKLSKEREQYVQQQKQQQAEKPASMNDALSEAVRKQATDKGFELGGS